MHPSETKLDEEVERPALYQIFNGITAETLYRDEEMSIQLADSDSQEFATLLTNFGSTKSKNWISLSYFISCGNICNVINLAPFSHIEKSMAASRDLQKTVLYSLLLAPDTHPGDRSSVLDPRFYTSPLNSTQMMIWILSLGDKEVVQVVDLLIDYNNGPNAQ
jgi:hypothetical protein